MAESEAMESICASCNKSLSGCKEQFSCAKCSITAVHTQCIGVYKDKIKTGTLLWVCNSCTEQESSIAAHLFDAKMLEKLIDKMSHCDEMAGKLRREISDLRSNSFIFAQAVVRLEAMEELKGHGPTKSQLQKLSVEMRASTTRMNQQLADLSNQLLDTTMAVMESLDTLKPTNGEYRQKTADTPTEDQTMDLTNEIEGAIGSSSKPTAATSKAFEATINSRMDNLETQIQYQTKLLKDLCNTLQQKIVMKS